MQAWNQQVMAAAHQAEAHAQHMIQHHMHLAAQQQQQDAAAAAATAGSAQAPPVHLFGGLHRYLGTLDAGLPRLTLTLPTHSHPSRAHPPCAPCSPACLGIYVCLDKAALVPPHGLQMQLVWRLAYAKHPLSAKESKVGLVRLCMACMPMLRPPCCSNSRSTTLL